MDKQTLWSNTAPSYYILKNDTEKEEIKKTKSLLLVRYEKLSVDLDVETRTFQSADTTLSLKKESKSKAFYYLLNFFK